jgi:Raf kinase inhibitor-like YbhB/YbcL family protein
MRTLLLGTAFLVGVTPALANEFSVTSPDFANGGPISMAQVLNAFGCRGENRSPALSWSGEPGGTQGFAVTMFDPDAPTGSGFWHWSVFNIPPTEHQLAARANGSTTLPAGAAEGRNDFGFSHYGGPCPPPGPAHHYHITVYAVKAAKLPLDVNSPGAVVAANLRANSLARAEIIGTYARSP